MLKTIAMALLALIFFYRLLLVSLSYSQSEKPLPADVKDIFDARDYQRFLAYADDKRKLAVIKDSFEAVLEELLLGFDVFAKLASVLPAASDLNQLFFVLILTAASFLLDLPFSVFEEMGIEKKYGFSQTSKKTFLADEIKEFIITMILSLGCISLVWLFYYLTGPYLVLCAFGTLIVFVLAMSSGSMRFMKLFNKFTPLPEGELKKRLTAMFTSYGYQLKDIYVMDASKRTSRSNAFCTGLGKFKSIALYDNLLHTLSEDEIVAVFAHELCHYRKHDTLKASILQLLALGLFVCLFLPFIYYPSSLESLGFSGLHLGMVLVLMYLIFGPIFFTLEGILAAYLSRRCEYRADQAAKEAGLGSYLVSGLKKMCKKDLADLNPHPWIVFTSYTHPTLSQRIQALEKQG